MIYFVSMSLQKSTSQEINVSLPRPHLRQYTNLKFNIPYIEIL